MTSQKNLDKFNDIYKKTYSNILRFIIIKCHNINDANDIIQEVYLELWKIMNKKEIDTSSINNYLIGIAINKIKKHYTLIERLKSISIFAKNDSPTNDIEIIKSDINIEKIIIKQEEWNSIWKYIKNKKNQLIPKIFYLYYCLDLSIKEIAKELNIKESTVKNNIYRTLKELTSYMGDDRNE